MATNPINQPFQPFQVQSSLLNDTSRAGNPGPQGPAGPRTPGGGFGDGDQSSDDPSRGYFGWLAALVFVALYALSQRYAQIAPLTIAVLIACVLFRLGPRERQFAAVPVAVAGIRLGLQLANSTLIRGLGKTASFVNPNVMKPMDFGIVWLPLFFSVCLFYMPKRISVTSKIILACSVVLLVSGLMPDEGYIYLFAMVQYFLFVAIAVGLLIDFVPKPAGSMAHAAGHGARA